MIDHTTALYCIVYDLLKGIGHTDDRRCEMSDAEVVTAALVAAFDFGGIEDLNGFERNSPRLRQLGQECRLL